MYQPHPLDARLAEALAPGRLFAVGGRVRDELRAELEGVDVPAKDLDYVVTGLQRSTSSRRACRRWGASIWSEQPLR